MLLSTPTLCVEYFNENSSLLLSAIWTTFSEAFLGLLVAIILAFSLMILCFYNSKFYKFILPIILGSQVIPIIVLAPFFIILLGLGLGSKVLMAALISFYPIFLNFSTGYNAIKESTHELMKIYKAKTKFKIFKIYFPLALPNIFAGIKVAVTLSVIGAIVAEMAGSEKGIGLNLLKTTFRTEPELMVWSILGSAIIGVVLFGIVTLLEKKIGFWYINKNQFR
jgi:NitT/TauT family transport system permease protein